MAKKDGTLDLRIKRTQYSIKKAFFELVEKNGFEHVTVKNITDRAVISRNTFYLHYTDKYDLLNKICDEMIIKLFFGVGKQVRLAQRNLNINIENAVNIMQFGLDMVDENRDAYRVILNSSGSDVLVKKVSDMIRRAIDLFKDDIEGIDNYSIEYIVSGLVGVIKYHVNNADDDCVIDVGKFAYLHLTPLIDSVITSKSEKLK